MPQRATRTHTCSPGAIERMRLAKGMSVESLAAKAGIAVKTVKRIISGKPAFLENIASLARALGTTCAALLNTPLTAQRPPNAGTFSVDISLSGVITSPEQSQLLVSLTPKIVAGLQDAGVKVTSATSKLALDSPDPLETTRIICEIFGLLEDGGPCWIIAAVRPSRYAEFLAVQKSGALNVYQFQPYGEIVTSGKGERASREVALEVARLFEVKDPEWFASGFNKKK